MLQEADTVGVFQVESRAQMATLPRLRPEKFYDLVIEVALIRPGPIQGGSVHPYMRRKRGEETPALPHESMRRALGKTLGVPLFQEQMMQIAIDCAGFSPTEADKLRQAMSSKRAPERIEELRKRLLDGMAERDIPPAVAEDIYIKILAFSSYGFPESHAISFAYLVYASAWLKRYYPAAFTAALLRNQPMGFYSPASLISDARRHGVRVRGVDINASAVLATLEPQKTQTRIINGWSSAGPAIQPDPAPEPANAEPGDNAALPGPAGVLPGGSGGSPSGPAGALPGGSGGSPSGRAGVLPGGSGGSPSGPAGVLPGGSGGLPPGQHRSGSGCPACGTWVPPRPPPSSPGSRTRIWRTSPAAPRCRRPCLRRWPRPARSAASGSAGARRCGRPARRPPSGRVSCRGPPRAWRRRRCRP